MPRRRNRKNRNDFVSSFTLIADSFGNNFEISTTINKIPSSWKNKRRNGFVCGGGVTGDCAPTGGKGRMVSAPNALHSVSQLAMVGSPGQ